MGLMRSRRVLVLIAVALLATMCCAWMVDCHDGCHVEDSATYCGDCHHACTHAVVSDGIGVEPILSHRTFTPDSPNHIPLRVPDAVFEPPESLV